MTAYGDLKIVASKDIGPAGPKDGPPVFYRWNPVWSLLPLVPWLIVAILLLQRPNRSLSAWVILVPTIIGAGLLYLIRMTIQNSVPEGIPFPPSITVPRVFIHLWFSLNVLWLGSYMLAGKKRGAFLSAYATLLVTGSVMAVFDSGLMFGASQFGSVVFLAIAALVVLGGIAMGGRMCRRQYSGSRFHGGFVLVLAIVAGIGGAAYIGFMVLVVGSFGGSFPMGIGFILTGVLILILGFSIMFYLFNLPFQLLAILNRTYNQRLRAILQIDTPIESPLTEPPPSTPDPPDTP